MAAEHRPALPELPVSAVLPDLSHALVSNGQAVLVAPPGAGKTTLVPLHLLDALWALPGKIILLEPRRLAARAAARRMAALLGEGHENQAYDITGPELVSYREVGQLIGEFTDQEVAIQLVDEAGLYAMFDAIGVPREPIENPGPDDVPWNSDDMVSFEVAVRDGHFAVDATDFERLTGSRPRTLRALFELKADDIAARMKAGAPA